MKLPIEQDRIEKQIELKAPLARVWRAVTDYREFSQWFGVNLEGPFIPGQTARGRITYGASLAYTGARIDTDFDPFPAVRVRLGAYWLAGARLRPGPADHQLVHPAQHDGQGRDRHLDQGLDRLGRERDEEDYCWVAW